MIVAMVRTLFVIDHSQFSDDSGSGPYAADQLSFANCFTNGSRKFGPGAGMAGGVSARAGLPCDR